MGDWFAKFPALPKNGRDTLAKISSNTFAYFREF